MHQRIPRRAQSCWPAVWDAVARNACPERRVTSPTDDPPSTCVVSIVPPATWSRIDAYPDQHVDAIRERKSPESKGIAPFYVYHPSRRTDRDPWCLP